MPTATSGSFRKLILIKPNQVQVNDLRKFYGDDFVAKSIPMKSTSNERKQLIEDLVSQGYDKCECVLCCDTDFFKTLCRVQNIKGLDGYPMDSPLGKAFVVPNYISILYNPLENQSRLDFIMDKVNKFLSGQNIIIGADIIHSGSYCYTESETKAFLDIAKSKPALAIDIETTGLHHYSNKLLSIGIAWDIHNGGAIDLTIPKNIELLREFFNSYTGKTIYHNCSFDITNLIYHLYMSSLEDFKGLLEGLHTLYRDVEDTKHIVYLVKNNCGKTQLGLKVLAHEYCGNYAEDEIDNAESIDRAELLKYNLTDCLATWYVYNKYRPQLITENQEEIYNTLFMPTQKVLIETQLVGFRIYPDRLDNLNNELTDKMNNLVKAIQDSQCVKDFTKRLRIDIVNEYNASHKNPKTLGELMLLKGFKDKLYFNPNSNMHLQQLLYNQLQLPVLDYTDSKQPATGGKTLAKLINHTQNQEIKDLLNNLIEYISVDKIVTAFMPSFYDAPIVNDRRVLCGSFNLGGTVSGRLSSSNPNLQQIPSTGSAYAKPVKKIFTSPKGFIFVGADQRSLMARRVA